MSQSLQFLSQSAANKSTSLWMLLLVVCIAGAIGGVVNALLSSDQGFVLPKIESGIIRLGFVGNILLGAVAAGLMWGLYGTAKNGIIFGGKPPGEQPVYSLTVAALIGAVAAGAAGARLISSEIDKRFFQKAAATAVAGSGKPDAHVKAAQIRNARGPEALAIAQS